MFSGVPLHHSVLTRLDIWVDYYPMSLFANPSGILQYGHKETNPTDYSNLTVKETPKFARPFFKPKGKLIAKFLHLTLLLGLNS